MSDRNWNICLGISLLTALFYGWLGLQTAFASDWIIQDDARQHVFWLARYLDSELFPHDLIADYFQSVAPWGYTSLYRFAISFGIDPFVFSKLIPVALRVVVAYYFFCWCRTIFPVSIGCLVSTLLLNHNLWLKDDIISATPRAFLYPFFLAFLYYFTKQALIPCAIAIIGLSLFYPQIVLIAWGMLLLKLIHWQGFVPKLNPNRQERIFASIGLVIGFLVLLPYALKTSDFAPVITRAEALTMPEFHYEGRSNFFKGTIWEYLIGRGNGVLISTGVFKPVILVIALFLPLVIKRSQKFSLAQKITPNFKTVSKLLLSSLGMYILAHIVLFRLHLPSRYTTHSLRIAVSLCAGITLTIVVDFLWQNCRKKYSLPKSKLLIAGIILTIFSATYINFFDPGSPTGYKIGSYPELYKFFQQQPKDTMIASLVKEADNLPTFTKRSVLVSREYAIPYQLGYYQPFSQKVRDLIKAQYSNNLLDIQNFIRQYKINYWLIEQDSFSVDIVTKNRWLKQYQKEYNIAIQNLQAKQEIIFLQYQNTCQIFSLNKFMVIDSKCLLKQRASS